MQADYIIIGSGSAGAALAYRLSESGKYNVLVLEYGGGDIGPFIQMPAALSYPMNMGFYDWGFVSQPEAKLGGRKLVVPRGKVIGGSSSVNGMVYVRGNAKDYDHWAEQGAKGWAYKDVLPYFKRMEHWHPGPHGGNPDWRGTDGPLHVRRGTMKNPLFKAFIKAGSQAGFPISEDYNGEHQEGFSPMEQTIHKGRRWSVANAYLRPALKRKNVAIKRCFVRKVIIEDDRATAVEISVGNNISRIKAKREIIISASSINTPKILMLSGIGPSAHLEEHGIEVVKDLPGVGQNLQDHLEVYVQQSSKAPVTLYKHWNLFSKAWIGAQWLFTKTGLGTSNHFEAASFLRSTKERTYPDVQMHFLPLAIRYDGKSIPDGHGYQIHTGPMRSKSRGAVTLVSSNPDDAPEIRFNYMSEPSDWVEFRAAIRLARKVFAQAAFEQYSEYEIQPGDDAQSDEAIDQFVAEHAESAFHPCGTAKMGARGDITAVVDEECRVIGIEDLRVVDSSIFPRITNGNLNAPSIMVGEKAADHILGKI